MNRLVAEQRGADRRLWSRVVGTEDARYPPPLPTTPSPHATYRTEFGIWEGLLEVALRRVYESGPGNQKYLLHLHNGESMANRMLL